MLRFINRVSVAWVTLPFCTSCTNLIDHGAPADLLNEGLGLTYSADLSPSSPVSYTAVFKSRDVADEAGKTTLANLNNVTVTLVAAKDSTGSPVWHETLEAFLTCKGYEPKDGVANQIRVSATLRNKDNGPVTVDLRSDPTKVTCSGGSIQVRAEKDLPYDPIGPSYKSTIEISRVSWIKCAA